MYTVYQHKNKVNDKVYIGITKRAPEDRWGVDGCNYKSSPHFYSAIQKYGWDGFEHIILFENLTKEQACSKEQELIAAFMSMNRNFGYNATSGGDVFELSEDARKKKSVSMIGNKNGAGHPCSEEKRIKISTAQKGRTLTEQHKEKLSMAATQRHIPCSEDKKKRLSENYPHKKKVYCEELDRVFDSVQQCGKELGIPATNISKLCRGRGKTLHGYHFRYFNDTINA